MYINISILEKKITRNVLGIVEYLYILYIYYKHVNIIIIYLFSGFVKNAIQHKLYVEITDNLHYIIYIIYTASNCDKLQWHNS